METPKTEFMLRGCKPLTAIRIYDNAPFKYKFRVLITPEMQKIAPVADSINYFLTMFYKFIDNDCRYAPRIRTNVLQQKNNGVITVTVETNKMIPLSKIWSIISDAKDKDVRFTEYDTEIKIKVFN